MVEDINLYEDCNLIVGAGLSGAAAARLIAECGENVLIIDKKPHLAGNSYDYKDENAIVIHKYGSHIFHTNNDEVWKFVNRFASFNTYMHRVVALIDGIEANIPFNLDSLYQVFPSILAKRIEYKLLKLYPYGSKIPILEFNKTGDEDLNFLSNYVYEKVFLNYTLKQWGKRPDEIDSSVSARVPVLISRDSRYFNDRYQGIPIEGISTMVENMLTHKNIMVILNADFNNFKNLKFKRVFYTGSIDEYFEYKFGVLKYRNVDFKFEVHDMPAFQSNSVVNYPNNYDFTRVHEFKHFIRTKSTRTVIAKEYSSDFVLGKNDRYYPIENKDNAALYEKYQNEAQKVKNLYFFGRLGDYKYYNMDKAIERAMGVVNSLFSSNIKISI